MVGEDHVNKENEVDPCDHFWQTIESETGSHIPSYIRNILKFNGFNSEMSIKLLEDEDLHKIEKLVRNGTLSNCVPKDSDFSTLYGPFEDKKENFTFLRGYRKMLLGIATHIKQRDTNNMNQKSQKSKSSLNSSKTLSTKHRISQLSSLKEPQKLMTTPVINVPGVNADVGQEIGEDLTVLFNKIRNWIVSYNVAAFEKVNSMRCPIKTIELIENAKTEATADVSEAGIDASDTAINFNCQVKYQKESPSSDLDQDLEYLYDPDDPDNDEYTEQEETFENSEENSIQDDTVSELSKDLHVLSSINGPLNLNRHNYPSACIQENSPYCMVSDGSRNNKPVFKSTIVWLLSRDKHSLSSDRMTRVKQSELVAKVHSDRACSKSPVTNENCLTIQDEVFIGEWCLITRKNKLLIGQVLSFSYLNGTNQRTREYSRTFAQVNDSVIGVLCMYYRFGYDEFTSEFTLEEEGLKSSYISLTNYIATIQTPKFENGSLYLNDELLARIIDFENELKYLDRVKTNSTSEATDEIASGVINESTSVRLDETELQLSHFVIVTVPTMTKGIQYFAGQISEICENTYKINFLKKQSKNTFQFPEKEDVSHVSRKEIVHKLREPVVNRRKQLIFEEIVNLNFVVR